MNLSSITTTGVYFTQTQDLDFASVTFAPLFSTASPFQGIYDGGNFALANITFSNTAAGSPSGIFVKLGASSVVKHLMITGLSMTGNLDVGGLAGQAGGSIQYVSLSGAVSGRSSTGGMVGRAVPGSTLSFSYCTTAGTVHSSADGTDTADSTNGVDGGQLGVGGILGSMNTDVTMSHSSSSATVVSDPTVALNYGSQGAGGLIGAGCWVNLGVMIDSSSFTGSVTGYYGVGGLLGELVAYTGASSITNSYSTGSVTGTNIVGGLVGLPGGKPMNVSKSYTSGTITGTVNVGGVAGAVGWSAGTYSQVFSSSNIVCPAGCVGYIGGFASQSWGSGVAITVNDLYLSGTITMPAGTTNVAGFGANLGANINVSRALILFSNITNTNAGSDVFATGSIPLFTNIYALNYGSNPANANGITMVVPGSIPGNAYTNFDFSTTPVWSRTSANAFATTNAPVLNWMCSLSGVTCI